MPSEVAFNFDTKDDWDLGAMFGVSASTVPGSLTPVGDFTQSFQPSWAGAKVHTEVQSNQLRLAGVPFGNTHDLGYSGFAHVNTGYTIYIGQRLNIRGFLASFIIKGAFMSYNYASLYPFVAKYSTGEILWLSPSANGSRDYTPTTMVAYPGILITDDIVVGFRSQGDQVNNPCSFCIGTSTASPPGAGGQAVYQTRSGVSSNPGLPDGNWNSYGYYAYVEYQLGFYESGTWTSNWIQHNIVAPKTAFAKWVSNVLTQSTVALEVRHSDDNGATFSDWYPVANASLVSGALLRYIQFRMTLTTEDASFSPWISSFEAIVQPEHRWVSPPQDLSDELISNLMIATSDFDILKSFKFGRLVDSTAISRASIGFNSYADQFVADRMRNELIRSSWGTLIEEAATNLCSLNQSDVESSTTGFVTSGSWNSGSASATCSTEKAYHGTHSLKVITNATAGSGAAVQILGTANRYYCMTARAWLPLGVSFTVGAYDSLRGDNGGTFTSTGISGLGTWQEISIGCKMGTTATTKLEFYVKTSNTGAQTFYLDYIMIQDRGGWYNNQFQWWNSTWQIGGTPRAAEILPLPADFVKGDWCIEFYYLSQMHQAFTNRTVWLWECFIDANNYYALKIQPTGAPYFEVKSGGTTYTVNAGPAISRAELNKCSIRGDGTNIAFFTGNSKRGEVAYVEPVGDLPANMYLGSDHNGANQANGIYQDVNVSHWRDDTDLAARYTIGLGSLLPADDDTISQYRLNSPKEFIEEGDIPSMLFDKTILGELGDVSFTVDISSMSASAALHRFTLYKAVLLQTLEDPVINVRPPEVTDITVFVQDSEPLIEASASLGVSADQKVEIRLPAPAGSTQQYAQDLANAYLALHGVEKKSITCKVPLASRISFGELISVAVPFWGFTVDNPWMAMVQKIAHRPLGIGGGPPHTELSLGDFEPDDTEALIRLLGKKE